MYDIKTIYCLLKDELHITNTYTQIMNKLRKDAKSRELRSLVPIYEGHKAAVISLQAQICNLNLYISASEFDSTSTIKTEHDDTDMLDLEEALIMLQERELNSTKDYESALLNNRLPESIRHLIGWKLLLRQQWYTRTLNELLDLMLAELDAETRFLIRAERGRGKGARGLELLENS